MIKNVKVGNKEIKLKSTAALPRQYRIKFCKDIFVDMEKLQKQLTIQEKFEKERKKEAKKKGIPYQSESSLPIEALELFENIAYIMNKHADNSQPDDIDEWLEQFDTFDIYEILPEILSLWNMDNEMLSKSKNMKEK